MDSALGGSADLRLHGAGIQSRDSAPVFSASLFSAPETIAIAYNLAAALTDAHSRHVYHLSIKPANVVFTDAACGLAGARSAALSNFDASNVAIAFRSATQEGAALDSESFMPPEMLTGRGGTGKGSASGNIWSLGVTLLSLLTGHVLGANASLVEKWAVLLFRSSDDWDRYVYLSRDAPEMTWQQRGAWAAAPEALRDLITRCLALSPEARPTAEDLLSLPSLVAERESRRSGHETRAAGVTEAAVAKAGSKRRPAFEGPFQARIGGRQRNAMRRIPACYI